MAEKLNMSDGNDRKLKKQVFHSKSNCIKSVKEKRNSVSDKKCRTEKNYQKNEILDENVYMLELIVFDDWVTKISLKPVNNSPT